MIVGIAIGRSPRYPVVVLLADIKLAADNRLDARGFGGIDEMHRAKNIAVVGHSHGRHAKLFGAITELLDVAGAVEHGIVSMKMKVYELRHSR